MIFFKLALISSTAKLGGEWVGGGMERVGVGGETNLDRLG